MSVEIRFEQPIGVEHPSLRFNPGEAVRITGTVRDFGMPGSFLIVDLALLDSFAPMVWQTRTNFNGNYWFDITLPNVVTLATVRVTADFIGPDETVQVVIGIGTMPPSPPPPPGGFLDKLLPWLIGAGVVLGAAYLAPVLVPLGKGAVRSARRAIR